MLNKFRLRSAHLRIAGVVLLTGCSNPGPRPRTIPEETFVDVSARVLVIRSEGTLRGVDSAEVERKADSLTAAFGLSRAQMQSETEYYRNDVVRWRQSLDKIIHRLEQLQREAGG
jgi:hypothetical protein